MESIKFDDDTLLFRKGDDKSFDELYDQFNRIIEELSKVKAAKEIEHQHFLSTVTHVPVGLISFDDDGNIEIFNPAAEKLLNLSGLRGIKELNQLHPELGDHIMQIETGKHEVFKVKIGHELHALLIRASKFKLENTNIKLVSIQDIRPELEEEEIIAWQKLIRVITHEIINSVSPISLLSSSLIKELAIQDKQSQFSNDAQVSAWLASLEAIQKRSEGLKQFVENYKSIAKVPEPSLSLVSIKELIEQVHILLKRDLEKESIEFSFKIIPANLQVTADEKLLEQVLINLVKNAMQALVVQDNKSISIVAFEVNGSPCIQVKDNGPGIAEAEMDNVFLPFYTTKSEGSGIGLNLSKQIMRAHKGKLTLESREGETVFSLIF
jgi:nitrogen fixation/metabolism regulation signal transduction histidine kinase